MAYAMSVIVSRALPSIYDGLKPVHRRIFYAMRQGGYVSDKPYRKSARIVGDVMGKFHPHGDQPIYEALVRMAQDFSMRLPLIDGQGNFGSMDGDGAAHMRYTEARLAAAAEELSSEIEFDTVDFIPNYDGTEQEPVLLPARFPNLLVNGVEGIAVGMSTLCPPHNLREIVAALINLLDHPDLSLEEIMRYVPGPDYPTGGIITGREGIRDAYRDGRGTIVLCARTSFEPMGSGRVAIIVHELPFQVNKARLVEKVAELARAGVIEGISDLRDESNRDGVRVVFELKRDATPEIVRNSLMLHTQLKKSVPVKMLALAGFEPRFFSLKEAMQAFLDFRERTIVRRTKFHLGQARTRAHVIAGFLVALVHIDEVITLIRASPTPAEARERLQATVFDPQTVRAFLDVLDEHADRYDDAGNYRFSDLQAKAILELRLQRLTGMEVNKLRDEADELKTKIERYLLILGDRDVRKKLIADELMEIAETYGTHRRTSFQEEDFHQDPASLIEREDMIVTTTASGYIKRVPLSTYRTQRRGGKGRTGMATKDGDAVTELIAASTHTPMLFFTSQGKVHCRMVYELPIGKPEARGKAVVNLLAISATEKITAMLTLPEVGVPPSADRAAADLETETGKAAEPSLALDEEQVQPLRDNRQSRKNAHWCLQRRVAWFVAIASRILKIFVLREKSQ